LSPLGSASFFPIQGQRFSAASSPSLLWFTVPSPSQMLPLPPQRKKPLLFGVVSLSFPLLSRHNGEAPPPFFLGTLSEASRRVTRTFFSHAPKRGRGGGKLFSPRVPSRSWGRTCRHVRGFFPPFLRELAAALLSTDWNCSPPRFPPDGLHPPFPLPAHERKTTFFFGLPAEAVRLSFRPPLSATEPSPCLEQTTVFGSTGWTHFFLFRQAGFSVGVRRREPWCPPARRPGERDDFSLPPSLCLGRRSTVSFHEEVKRRFSGQLPVFFSTFFHRVRRRPFPTTVKSPFFRSEAQRFSFGSLFIEGSQTVSLKWC